MHHSSIDQYAKNSRFYSLDPRSKIIGIFVFVVIVSLIKDLHKLIISDLFIITVIAYSKIPIHHILKRYLVAFPFILFTFIAMFISKDYLFALKIFFRISCCVLALILLSSTTPFFDLLKGFQNLKVPNIFIILLLFTYRYFFVFIEELHRMKLARKARAFQGGMHLFDKKGMKTISYTIGMVLVRAYDRGVRIYDALLIKGFNGKIKTLRSLKFTPIDFIFCLIFISISFLLIFTDIRVIF